MKEFRVGTFYTRRLGPVRKSHILAYTVWYSPEWGGCVEYDIEAINGFEAKRKAVIRRYEEEAAKDFRADPDHYEE